jgi:hypothetical protein
MTTSTGFNVFVRIPSVITINAKLLGEVHKSVVSATKWPLRI